MPSKIRVLDEQTINQIAAGEVIENPSSVVKELVENSLDAGASQIVIEIAGGGRQLIRVIDNGSGMSSDDALLCLQRHATSKIQKTDDLSSVSTMGFRGEAIPSIAAVSKLTLITSQRAAEEEGTIISVEGGTILHHGSAPCAPGTTLEVKSLFYNTPVRRKFQKSIAIDTAEILKVISHLALANPQTSFQLIASQKQLLSTNSSFASNFLEQLQIRASDVLGTDFLESALIIDYTEGGIRVQGLIGTPSTHRNNRSGQYLFINQRDVTSPLISSAVSDGYGTLLPPRRFPSFVLHIFLPGDLVDVNVHPQKKEVRLRSSQNLRSLLSRAIEKTLQAPQSNFAVNHIDFFPSEMIEESVEYSPLPSTSIRSQDYMDVESTPAPINHALEDAESFGSSFEFPPSSDLNNPVLKNRVSNSPMNNPRSQEESSAYSVFFQPKLAGIWKHFFLLDAASLPDEISLPPTLTLQKGLLIIDQRAAHRRVLFEDFLKQKQVVDSQQLLIPVQIEFSRSEALFLNDYIDDLNRMGIGIRLFGERTFIIEALPHTIPISDVQALMMEIVSDLNQFSREAHLKKQKNIQAALAASKAAISRKTHLTQAEAEDLVKRLFTCENPFQCPQGKSTMGMFTMEEFQKKLTNSNFE